ncbi:hypothetical protein GCM10022226_73830 [Sphaerisporangium flaviroseum]|uniref:Uncharacterized protein n=1 Tax=Sphaerisporangium flaviroseum TaxID=509199 RepID=A0ABP7JD21_9ACTN
MEPPYRLRGFTPQNLGPRFPWAVRPWDSTYGTVAFLLKTRSPSVSCLKPYPPSQDKANEIIAKHIKIYLRATNPINTDISAHSSSSVGSRGGRCDRRDGKVRWSRRGVAGEGRVREGQGQGEEGPLGEEGRGKAGEGPWPGEGCGGREAAAGWEGAWRKRAGKARVSARGNRPRA